MRGSMQGMDVHVRSTEDATAVVQSSHRLLMFEQTSRVASRVEVTMKLSFMGWKNAHPPRDRTH